jgi:large exoprotein involved in heme utilization and adhesion
MDHGVTLSAKTFGQGTAGHITLQSQNINLASGANIQSNTSSAGNAGNINVVATQSLLITGNNSGIFSNTEDGSTGNAGNITIDPPVVNLQNGAGIAVNSLGSGTGGNITLTRSSGGGNITLTIGDQLRLQNNSFLSTEAGTAQSGGNGGNISINAQFIIGSNNADIIANAFQGNGGRIDITTRGLLGFTVKNTNSPLTDSRNNITASSQFGSSGITNINNAVDPAQGLGTLPGNLVDPSSLIDRRCAVTDVAKLNKFSITGRGGIPENPTQVLQNRRVLEDLGDPQLWEEKLPAKTTRHPINDAKNLVPSSPASINLLEARTLAPLANGSVRLKGGVSTVFSPILHSCLPPEDTQQ